MQIYIRRNNEEFGPYSREVVLEYVKRGIFKVRDHACYAGMPEWKTVGELLGISAASAHDPNLSPSGKITEFNPAWAPPSAGRPSRRGGGKRGLMIALNVGLILIVAALAYLRLGGGQNQVRNLMALASAELPKPANAAASPAAPGAVVPNMAAAPAPAPKASSTPAPVVTPAPAIVAITPPPQASSPVPEATPDPAPAAATIPPELTAPSTPPPAAASTPGPPKPFDPADLASNPAAWPKTLRLKQAVEFPALFNSQVVGSVTAPSGTVVKLDNIQGDRITVDFQGGTQTISWKLTDLEEQIAKRNPGSAAPSPGNADGLVAPPR
jgi:hypothetical protein